MNECELLEFLEVRLVHEVHEVHEVPRVPGAQVVTAISDSLVRRSTILYPVAASIRFYFVI